MVEKALLYIQNYKYWYTKYLTDFIPKRESGYNIRNGNKPWIESLRKPKN